MKSTPIMPIANRKKARLAPTNCRLWMRPRVSIGKRPKRWVRANMIASSAEATNSDTIKGDPQPFWFASTRP